MKTCAKCNAPIEDPVLGDDPHEICVECDETTIWCDCGGSIPDGGVCDLCGKAG